MYGKAEFLNPGGSVKDRAALGIIAAAEAHGTLARGGTIVEGTAGNTGIAIALIANARGYHSIIVVPYDQLPEKYAMLRTFGADLRIVPAVPFTNEQNSIASPGASPKRLPGRSGPTSSTTRPTATRTIARPDTEIECDLGHVPDAFVTACGTGGTLAGVARYLKERDPHVRICLADPWVRRCTRTSRPAN